MVFQNVDSYKMIECVYSVRTRKKLAVWKDGFVRKEGARLVLHDTDGKRIYSTVVSGSTDEIETTKYMIYIEKQEQQHQYQEKLHGRNAGKMSENDDKEFATRVGRSSEEIIELFK